MSKENGVMSQHIIQRALLDRFTNRDGNIIVHRFDGNMFLRSYSSNPKNIACANNYYDMDPYSESSLETKFRPRETKGQQSMDHVLNGGCEDQLLESIVDYVGLMLGKDPSLLESIKRVWTRQTGEPVSRDNEY